MRTGISTKIARPDRRRLEAITKDRNASQKHAWRAAIVLLSADDVGTNKIVAAVKRGHQVLDSIHLVSVAKCIFALKIAGFLRFSRCGFA